MLRPGDHLFQEQFFHLSEDGLTATFDRAQALAYEDDAFLTWEHPLTREAHSLSAWHGCLDPGA